MYTMKLDGKLLWDPRVKKLAVTDPKLELEINRAGVLTFKTYPDHPLYGEIHKLKSIVEVYSGERLLFRGRPLNDDVDTWNIKNILCEGELAFLNDSIVRPYTFTGSISNYLEWLINNHNSSVTSDKRFTIGRVTAGENAHIERENQDYPTTWREIENQLLGPIGGYLFVRRDNGVYFLDYLDDSSEISNQVIRVGHNLLNVFQERQGADIGTALIPLGMELETDDEGLNPRVNITSVNGGVDFIYDTDAVEKYGWIFKTVVFDDISDPLELLNRGIQSLRQFTLLRNTIELTAVDLNLVDTNIDDLRIFEYVRIDSAVHQIDDFYLIRKMDIDLINPTNNKIQIGAQFATFTEKQFKVAKNFENVKKDVAETGKAYLNTIVTNATVELSESLQLKTEIIKNELNDKLTAKVFNSGNLNFFMTPGAYYCEYDSQAVNVLNSPTSKAFLIVVEQHSGYKQTVTTLNTLSPEIFMRNYTNGVWGAWYKSSLTLA